MKRAPATATPELGDLKQLLTDRFGGVTEFSRAPAAGLWKETNEVEQDDIVIVEVMTDTLDEAWWAELRQNLERRLDQKEIVIRAHEIRRL
jgi:hypothetical protein